MHPNNPCNPIRVSLLQAKLALEHCVKMYPDGFNPQEYNFDDMTEHEGKEELFKLWLSRLDTESVVEHAANEEAEASADLEEGSVDEEEVNG